MNQRSAMSTGKMLKRPFLLRTSSSTPPTRVRWPVQFNGQSNSCLEMFSSRQIVTSRECTLLRLPHTALRLWPAKWAQLSADRMAPLVALGMNEVPKSGGGAYWCSDENDGRDFRWGFDTSDRMREDIFAEILQRLRDAKWLAAHPERSIPDLVAEMLRTGDPSSGCPPIMKGAQFLSTIDYVRAVHAEMAALTDAARHGVSTDGCALYTTTFPCHDCAKHLVAAGIARVVYIEPYRKSLVQELYPDSVVVDPVDSCAGKVRFEPFVGVAPRRYSDLFGHSGIKRKDKDGALLQWKGTEAVPRLPEYMPFAVARLASENEEVKLFFGQLRNKGLAEPKD